MAEGQFAATGAVCAALTLNAARRFNFLINSSSTVWCLSKCHTDNKLILALVSEFAQICDNEIIPFADIGLIAQSFTRTKIKNEHFVSALQKQIKYVINGSRITVLNQLVEEDE